MGWFDKIKSLTTKQDASPELKKGEIKDILIAQAKIDFPNFEFSSYKNGRCLFQRIRKAGTLTAFETFQILSSPKNKSLECSVASVINPFYIGVSHYNNGIINPHKDLIVLKKGTGSIPIEEAYYFHNGKVETATKVIREIFNDYKKYAIPFLDKQYALLTNNEIVKAGLEYISKLTIDKNELKEIIEKELSSPDHKFPSIQHDIYVKLKDHLRAVPGQTKELRQLNSKTSHEILELYWAL